VATALVALPSADAAVGLLVPVRSSFSDRVQAFELVNARGFRFVARHLTDGRLPFPGEHPWYVLLDIDTGGDPGVVERLLGDALESGSVSDVVVAKNVREAERLWRLRHAISEAQKFEGVSLKHDVSVPIGRTAEFLRAAEALTNELLPDARPVIFGHVGDGNLHYNVSGPRQGNDAVFREAGEEFTARFYDLVGDFRGSISAEHGIGLFKREALRQHRGGVELMLMRALKNALDPRNTLNPGKVI
jgi:FAD/FMN-containing dehydrogenase